LGEKLIKVRVYPISAREGVEEAGEEVVVKVSAPPRGGKANKRLIELLSEHYRIPKSKIEIIRGFRSREKLVRVEIG